VNNILEFQSEFRFLSNFWKVRNISVEHAYQAAKAPTWGERFVILNAEKPGDAKRAGKHVLIPEDWKDIKEEIMYDLVKAKFIFDLELKRKLLATGQVLLQEGNRWGDIFWGVDIRTGRGQNRLGKILMRVRRELQ
jgi:ribA/ribD-fused uncharacterized protein